MSTSALPSIDHKPMNLFQWSVIGICMIINVIDGFDVLVMAFTASAVSAHWNLTGAQLGGLLSASLVGMSLGSFFLAPWADKVGRRPLILVCLVISGSGMLLAAYSQSPVQLGLTRFITGIGIGGILASTNVVASEYASLKWRNLAVSLQATGYTVGALCGGMIAIALLQSYGWRSVFTAGGILTLGMVPIVYLFLPESLDFLVTRQPHNALARVRKLSTKLGLESPASLPPAAGANVAKARFGALITLLGPKYLKTTVFLWGCSFLILFGFYFVMSWTPKLLTTAGLSAQQGITGGVLLSVGGIFGTALLGMLSSRFRLVNVQIFFLLGTAVLMSCFVAATTQATAAFVVGLLLGVTVNGCLAGLIALAPGLYDASVRTTGLGLAIGVGRIGGMLSPLVAGRFLDAGWTPGALFALFACAFGSAMLVTLFYSRRLKTVAPVVAAADA